MDKKLLKVVPFHLSCPETYQAWSLHGNLKFPGSLSLCYPHSRIDRKFLQQNRFEKLPALVRLYNFERKWKLLKSLRTSGLLLHTIVGLGRDNSTSDSKTLPMYCTILKWYNSLHSNPYRALSVCIVLNLHTGNSKYCNLYRAHSVWVYWHNSFYTVILAELILYKG